jgi:hypothetical protein
MLDPNLTICDIAASLSGPYKKYGKTYMHSKPSLISQRPAANRALALLVLIIALGQINSISHAFDIDASHPGDCDVCTQIQIQGHGIPLAHPPLPPVPLADISTAIYGLGTPTAFPHIPGSRAPPPPAIS